jgi:Protein of unknown function (DUF2815)
MGTIVQLKHVRIAFIDDLFEPGQFEGQGDFRHTATLIVEPTGTNFKAVEDAIAKEAFAMWGKKADSMMEDIRGSKNKCAWMKNKKDRTGEVYDGFEDKWALSAVRKQKDGAPLFLHNISEPDPDKPGKTRAKRLRGLNKETGRVEWVNGFEGVIYAGCYVNAKVELWAQSGKYSGMRCGLLGVQFDGPGDSFGGASRVSDDGFDAIEAEDDLA